MLGIYGRMMGNMVRVGEAWSEIASLAPQVVALRADRALAALVRPSAVPSGEPVRMVVEKIDALAAGAVAATLETGLVLGRSLTGQSGPLDGVVDIAMAAVAPTRGRLRANVARLAPLGDAVLPTAAE